MIFEKILIAKPLATRHGDSRKQSSSTEVNHRSSGPKSQFSLWRNGDIFALGHEQMHISLRERDMQTHPVELLLDPFS